MVDWDASGCSSFGDDLRRAFRCNVSATFGFVSPRGAARTGAAPARRLGDYVEADDGASIWSVPQCGHRDSEVGNSRWPAEVTSALCPAWRGAYVEADAVASTWSIPRRGYHGIGLEVSVGMLGLLQRVVRLGPMVASDWAAR